MVANCTPCDASLTVSRSGHFVALTRRRKSATSAAEKFTRNGRMAVLSVLVSWAAVVIASVLSVKRTATLGLAGAQKRRPSIIAHLLSTYAIPFSRSSQRERESLHPPIQKR